MASRDVRNNWVIQKFQTPAALPDNRQCRSLLIPDDAAWAGIFNNVLNLLTDPNVWEQQNDTDMTPEDCAAYMDEAYTFYLESATEGNCMDDICDRMADCLYNSDTVSDALIWKLIGLGLLEGDGTPIGAVLGASVTPAGTGCDDSDRYGMGLAMVAALDRLVTDVFEVLTPYTEVVDIATELLTIIPILGPLIAAAFNVAAFLYDYSASVYAAAYSETVQSDIACALMCYWNDCELPYQNLMECYRDLLAGYTPPGAFASVSEVCTWLASLTLSGDTAIVCAVQYVILTMWAAGGTVKQAKPTFLTSAAYGADPSDPSGICDACQSCYGRLDGDGNSGMLVVPYAGYSAVYNSTDDRYEAVWDHNHGSGKFLVVRTPNSLGNFNELHLAWDVQNSRSAAGVLSVVGNPGGTTLYTNNGFPPDGQDSIVLHFGASYTQFQILLACRTWDDDADAHAYLAKVEMCPTT